MPSTFLSFSILSPTSITILVDGNLTMVQGDLRHMDRSTTISNTDAFNVELESTVAAQQPTTVAPTLIISPDSAVEHHDNDSDIDPSSASGAPHFPGAQASQRVEVTILTQGTVHNSSPVSSIRYQSSTEAIEPQVSPAHSRSSNSVERGSVSIRITTSEHADTVLIKTNRFKSVAKKIRARIKRAFGNYFSRVVT